MTPALIPPWYNKILGTMKVCYIRYFVTSVVYKQYQTKQFISLGQEKTVCYIRYFVISDLFISSFHCIYWAPKLPDEILIPCLKIQRQRKDRKFTFVIVILGMLSLWVKKSVQYALAIAYCEHNYCVRLSELYYVLLQYLCQMPELASRRII